MMMIMMMMTRVRSESHNDNGIYLVLSCCAFARLADSARACHGIRSSDAKGTWALLGYLSGCFADKVKGRNEGPLADRVAPDMSELSWPATTSIIAAPVTVAVALRMHAT